MDIFVVERERFIQFQKKYMELLNFLQKNDYDKSTIITQLEILHNELDSIEIDIEDIISNNTDNLTTIQKMNTKRQEAIKLFTPLILSYMMNY